MHGVSINGKPFWQAQRGDFTKDLRDLAPDLAGLTFHSELITTWRNDLEAWDGVVHIVSERVLEVLLRFDPDAILYHRADIKLQYGRRSTGVYYALCVKRLLWAADLHGSHITADTGRNDLFPWYPRNVGPISFRKDLPTTLHIFGQLTHRRGGDNCTGRQISFFVSRELARALKRIRPINLLFEDPADYDPFQARFLTERVKPDEYFDGRPCIGPGGGEAPIGADDPQNLEVYLGRMAPPEGGASTRYLLASAWPEGRYDSRGAGRFVHADERREKEQSLFSSGAELLNGKRVKSWPRRRFGIEPYDLAWDLEGVAFRWLAPMPRLDDFERFGSIHMVSERLLEILLRFDPTGFQHTPVRTSLPFCIRPRVRYHAINVTRFIWAADLEASVVQAKSHGSGQPWFGDIGPLVFRNDIPENVHIFKQLTRRLSGQSYTGAGMNFFVSRELATAIEHARITNIKFENPALKGQWLRPKFDLPPSGLFDGRPYVEEATHVPRYEPPPKKSEAEIRAFRMQVKQLKKKLEAQRRPGPTRPS